LTNLWTIEAEFVRSGQLGSTSASLPVASGVSRLAATRQIAVIAVVFQSPELGGLLLLKHRQRYRCCVPWLLYVSGLRALRLIPAHAYMHF
jgi:hypothetical protein